MRGHPKKQLAIFSTATLETLVDKTLPLDHPLRRIRARTDEILRDLSPEFDKLYAKTGRPSVPPEHLLKALLWMALFSVRSERQLVDVLQYDLRCRWFVGLDLEQKPWDHSTFSRARESVRLETVAELFFERHVQFLRDNGLISNEHLSVDGTLLAAWASHKSLVRRDELDQNGKAPPSPEGGRNGWVDFKGTKRSNETHVSASDPESRLASRGTGAKLCYELSVLTENRNNLIVSLLVSPPSGTSERDAAATLLRELIAAGHSPTTLGADSKYAEGERLVETLVDLGISPHFAVRPDRPNAPARLFQNDDGYDISLRLRMRIEEVFGYIKTICGLAKLKLRSSFRVYGASLIAASANNLMREARLATI